MKILVVIIILAVIICLFMFPFSRFTKKRREEKAEYDSKYRRIQHFIDFSEVTLENYEIIERMFKCLCRLPYKNKEKTSVLYVCQFLRKFEKVIKMNVTDECVENKPV